MKHLVLVVLVVLVGCATAGARRPGASGPDTAANAVADDLQMVCDETHVAARLKEPDRATAFASAVQAKLKTQQARNIFKAASAVEKTKHHATWLAGATELKIAWSCKAGFESVYGPQE